MDIAELQKQQTFHIHQKITMMVNRYHVFTDVGGEPGELVAFVEQKRMKFKEEVTIFTDESKTWVVGGFKARKAIDVSGSYDVTGPGGQPVGLFSKSFGKSLLRSTWLLEQPGKPSVTVSERSGGMALFRRIWGFIPWIGDWPFPWKYHFEFLSGERHVATFEKKTRFRDHYLLRIDEPALDRILAIAHAIALDALQSR
ncbi:MAG: hypothetical protein L0K86_08885 [Actinomycetia bacterium]|nr:hypothetical protein [Actinomycetes bacterium]